MRIIIVGQFGIESFGLHIKENLLSMGHDIVACVPFIKENEAVRTSKRTILDKITRGVGDKLLFSSKSNRNLIMKRIIGEVCAHVADLVICTKDYFLDYEIEQIKRNTHAIVAMWYPDHLMNFGNASFLTAGYDYLFFKDPFIVRNLRNIYKVNAIYLPECFSTIRHVPAKYDRNDEIKYSCDISAIGNIHSFRAKILSQLTEYDMKIYGIQGPWWLDTTSLNEFHTGKYLAYEEKAKAIKYSKINLNTLYFGEIEGVNVRTFEIAGMRGFQLLQFKAGINELFEIGNDVETFESIEELKEKIDYYLLHQEERERIANNGYNKALSCHTYEHRLRRMISIVESNRLSESDCYSFSALSN